MLVYPWYIIHLRVCEISYHAWMVWELISPKHLKRHRIKQVNNSRYLSWEQDLMNNIKSISMHPMFHEAFLMLQRWTISSGSKRVWVWQWYCSKRVCMWQQVWQQEGFNVAVVWQQEGVSMAASVAVVWQWWGSNTCYLDMFFRRNVPNIMSGSFPKNKLHSPTWPTFWEPFLKHQFEVSEVVILLSSRGRSCHFQLRKRTSLPKTYGKQIAVQSTS